MLSAMPRIGACVCIYRNYSLRIYVLNTVISFYLNGVQGVHCFS